MNANAPEDDRMTQDLADLNHRHAAYQQWYNTARRTAERAVARVETQPPNLEEAEQFANLAEQYATVLGELADLDALTLARVESNPAEARRALNGNVMIRSTIMPRLTALEEQIFVEGQGLEWHLSGRNPN